MKKVFLFLSFLLACVVLVNAQLSSKDSFPPLRHPMAQGHFQQPNFRGGMRMNRAMPMHKGMPYVNYTKEQREQLKTINEDYQKQLLELQGKNNITLGEYKTRLAELRKSRKEKAEGVLTDEQKQKMDEAKKNADINRQVNATARLERLKLTLNLSDEQVAKIKDQQQSLQTQMKTIRENGQLFPEQKREQTKQLMQQHKDDLKSVLTDDQKKILDKQKSKFGNKKPEHGLSFEPQDNGEKDSGFLADNAEPDSFGDHIGNNAPENGLMEDEPKEAPMMEGGR